jgi:ABC-type multidrug transport system fused ATPase/permease subunit
MGAIVFAVLISTIFRKSAIAIAVAIISWIGLMVLDSFYTTSLTNIPHCFLVSLNIYTAFKLGIKSAIMAETSATYLGWTNMFTNSTHSFTFGFATIMLIFDIVLMILISLYLDAVWPTDDSPRRSPFFIFGYKSHSGSRFDVSQDEVDAPEENVEPDSVINRDEADIDVRRMSKIWETTGQMAVDNVSFRAYRGQVTVLLGHNGKFIMTFLRI